MRTALSWRTVLTDDDLKAMSNQPKPWWGLGMSETLGPYSYGDDFRAEGYPVCAPMDHWADGYEVRIADDSNMPVGDGEIGELQIRGYPVTTGLHKIERDEHFTPDGYYHTGDMCLVDGTRVNFIGRGGDMIKTAGANVSPREVEAAIADGRGAVLALPHLGNWDFAGAWLALQGYTVTVVAEPVDPPELFDHEAEQAKRIPFVVDVQSVLLDHLDAFRREAEAAEAPWRAIAQEYIEGRGPFPDRIHVNALFWVLLDRWAQLRADWASWAADQVASWPDSNGPADRAMVRQLLEQALSVTTDPAGKPASMRALCSADLIKSPG